MQCDPDDKELIDALEAVCRSVETKDDAIVCRNGSATLRITKDRVEGSMPLHHAVVSPVDDITIDEGAVTVTNDTTTYKFRLP